MNERMEGIVAEIGEIADLAELKALWCFGQVENNAYADAACVPHFKAAFARLKNQKKEEVPMETMNLEARIAELLAQVEALKGNPPVQAPHQPIVRGSKRYRLLSTDVSWSTKPQVRALMEVLAAHVEVGGELSEATIVEAMVANEAVLETRQGGKRIWDYYKGNHAEGLRMHGNVEVVQ
jgi:hypothetical protein